MLNSITLISSIILPIVIGLSSPITPFMTYNHSVSLQVNVSELWWTVNEDNQTIIFELHIKTTGWIALGISPGNISHAFDLLIRNFAFFSSWRNDGR